MLFLQVESADEIQIKLFFVQGKSKFIIHLKNIIRLKKPESGGVLGLIKYIKNVTISIFY